MKEICGLGEIPDPGVVPKYMHAAVIRPERFGQPMDAIKVEQVRTPEPGYGQVLILVMAAGVNYNNVWAALGKPIDVVAMRQRQGEPEDFHIGGSDGSGIVWAAGPGVTGVQVGDEVVLSGAQWDERADDVRFGGNPIASTTMRAWGYEANYGTFAQFALAYDYQCHPKPKNLTWAESASYMLTGATAYRQLTGWHPHTVEPGDPVLIWGGSGGLGSMAIQITRARGGIPIAVVSSPERAEYCRQLGAEGTINRQDYHHWGRLPDIGDAAAYREWLGEAKRFGRAIWDVLGEARAPKIVLEHSGEATLPTSLFVCDNAGMVVLCGGTSGYNGDIDLRYLWMRQKRLQGSHYADLSQCRRITELVAAGRISPCLTQTYEFDDIATAHQVLHDNVQTKGNVAVTVNAA
ncbi:crotonyl-CoA carboxylase/reductase [Nocardia terpenica]|uniref:Crotonyl-CoA carboxylase/reductase n=1 Tax=Nocardia terpenica TaxID=455432 RepID=A0A6G9ZE51_9NOCA|nr:crotonyl-CoA carboxylase/reductase [Nocardia terpenica]QIS23273.1 crotonyl-CoA carboxylase/reductase [Nocardia terpenica]